MRKTYGDRQTDRHEDRQTQKKKATVPSGYKAVGAKNLTYIVSLNQKTYLTLSAPIKKSEGIRDAIAELQNEALKRIYRSHDIKQL